MAEIKRVLFGKCESPMKVRVAVGLSEEYECKVCGQMVLLEFWI